MKKLKIISAIMLTTLGLFAQSLTPEVFAVSGGSNTVGDINLTWTIGEPFTETFINNEYRLSQGFNQDSIIITLIESNIFTPIEVAVYPNPTNSIIKIDIKSEKSLRTRSVIYDFNGKELFGMITGDNNYEINLSAYQKGVYILIIYNDQNNFIRKFKIEKL
jgi:hypothetical protein